MKCEHINQAIDDFLEQNLNRQDLVDFKNHVSECQACADKLELSRVLAAGLRQLPVAQPSAGFRQRVFAQVRSQYKTEHRQGYGYTRFAAGFASALVVSLAIWFVTNLYVPDTLVDQPQMISVAMHQTQNVRLSFDAQRNFQQVQLSIDLPANIELDGFPGQKTLSWQTSLVKGQNILTLPVFATAYGQGELQAQLRYGDKLETFRILLKANADGVQHNPLNKARSA